MNENSLTQQPLSKVIVISGPTGSGESTVTQQLIKRHESLTRLVTATTRDRRDGEVDGVDYHFFPKSKFLDALKKGLISECTHIANRDVYYGSYEPDLKDKLARGYSVIVNTDIIGTRYYKEHYNAITIFLDPGDLSSIAGRLKNRNPEITEEEIQARLQNAEREIACEMPFYEHVVKNEDGQLEQAVRSAEALVFG